MLLRAIRSVRLGIGSHELPSVLAGYASVEVPSLCAFLCGLAREVLRGDEDAARELDIWRGFYGLGDLPPASLQKIGRRWSIGPGRAGQLRRVVDVAVAAVIEPREAPSARLPPLDVPAAAGTAQHLHIERAVAQVHAETAIRGGEREVRVVESLSREVLGQPRLRSHAGGSPRPRDPNAHRTRNRLRAEIALHQQSPTLGSQGFPVDEKWVQRLTSAVRSLPSDVVDQETARRSLIEGAPDLDLIRTLVHNAEKRHRDRTGSVVGLLRVIDLAFARFESSPDPVLEARALGIGAARFREAEHMGTYVAARRIEALVGPRHPLTITALDDAALVLRANRYLDLSDDALHRVRTELSQRDCAPGIRGLMLSNISTSAVVASNSLSRPNADTRVREAHHRLETVLTAIEQSPDGPLAHWRTVILRRQIQLDLAKAIATKEDSRGRYRIALPRATSHWRAEAALAAKQARGGPWPMSWALQEMRIAIAQREPDAFWGARDQAAQFHSMEPHFPNLVVDFNMLIDRTKAVGWMDPHPVRISVNEDSELMALVRPDRLGTV
jgi:hypothetical protein